MALMGRMDRKKTEAPISRGDWPYALGMILLDILAPILLMLGLERTTAANAALLNNFEIVATSLIAAALAGETLTDWSKLPIVLLLGFVAYGLSIYFYVYAQRDLGAVLAGVGHYGSGHLAGDSGVVKKV